MEKEIDKENVINNAAKSIADQIYFPHDEIRAEQHKLISDVLTVLENKTHLIAHAPTGLGKTAAALAPCLHYALKNKLTIFFLTSRHTQHLIALQTLQKIKRKHDLQFTVADIIGKKWMCAMPSVSILPSSDFAEFCKAVKEHDKCEFYMNTRAKNSLSLSVLAKKVLEDVKTTNGRVDEVMQLSVADKVCPYEISLENAKNATVIIADYYYIFNQKISDMFLRKIGKELKDIIVIIDEAHNLPKRMSELASHKLSSFIVKAAIQEAKKHNYPETINNLTIVQNAMNLLAKDMNEFSGNKEKIVTMQSFVDAIKKEKDYDELIAELIFIADNIREEQKKSFIGSIALFLESWITFTNEKSFARILSLEQSRRFGNAETVLSLSYRCLDPSVLTSTIVDNAHSCIFMSGTLSPTAMYRDLLGVQDCIERNYQSPFPENNKLNLIIPKTTTKFSLRNEDQFKKMAEICAEIVDEVPGNSMIFFPSYSIQNNVNKYFATKTKKTVFTENAQLVSEEKKQMLENFKAYKDVGAVLLAATTGSSSTTTAASSTATTTSPALLTTGSASATTAWI